MEILELIDKLDDLMYNAKPVPLTDQVRVDKGEVLDVLDQMRAVIPELLAQERADATAAGVDHRVLTEAVSDAIKENVPEIARAVAAATSGRADPGTPPPATPF
jgi:hypothetical protein